MLLKRMEQGQTKGWYTGAWDSGLPVAVGYAGEGIDDPHVHHRLTEVYLIAQGSAIMRVEQETIRLEAGDVVVVEPGEAHTFLLSTDDYFHFVLHVPSLPPAELAAERSRVPRSRLGLSDGQV